MQQAETASGPAATAAPPAADSVEGIALRWFDQMRAGQIDRAELHPDYNAQLTNDAVEQMSRFLTAQHYGVPPKRVEIVHRRVRGDQTFHVVKLIYPRGDAASLLLGIDGQGRITGVNVMTMAGD